MSSIAANTINETWKILSKKKTIAFLILSVIIPFVGALLISGFQGQTQISAITGGDYPLLMLSLYTMLFLPLFIFMGAADVFSGEAGSKTLKLTLVRPISRFKIFVSKNMSLAIYIGITMTTVLIISLLCSFWINRGGSSPAGVGSALTAYLAAFVPMLALSIAAVFFAQFFKSSSGALTLSILLYAAFKIAAMMVPEIASLSLFSMTDWYMLWLGNTIPMQKIIYGFILMLSYSIIFFAAGFYLFDKKEF